MSQLGAKISNTVTFPFKMAVLAGIGKSLLSKGTAVQSINRLTRLSVSSDGFTFKVLLLKCIVYDAEVGLIGGVGMGQFPL